MAVKMWRNDLITIGNKSTSKHPIIEDQANSMNQPDNQALIAVLKKGEVQKTKIKNWRQSSKLNIAACYSIISSPL